MPHYDPAPYREARGNERWMLVGAFLLALGALVAIVLEDYEPVKLAPVFMLIAWFPLIALHELGHAVAAKLAGWEVDAIVVGFGGIAFAFELFGVPCAIKMYPLGGFVRPAPLDLSKIRVKSALVYLAGPGVELVLVLGLLAALGWDTMTTRTEAVGVIAAQAVAVAALIDVVTNLVPRGIDTEHGASFTDGMGFLRSWLRPRTELEAWVRACLLERLEDARAAHDLERAAALSERAYRAMPSDAHLRSAIRRVLRSCLSELDPEERARALEGRGLPEAIVGRLLG